MASVSPQIKTEPLHIERLMTVLACAATFLNFWSWVFYFPGYRLVWISGWDLLRPLIDISLSILPPFLFTIYVAVLRYKQRGAILTPLIYGMLGADTLIFIVLNLLEGAYFDNSWIISAPRVLIFLVAALTILFDFPQRGILIAAPIVGFITLLIGTYNWVSYITEPNHIESVVHFVFQVLSNLSGAAAWAAFYFSLLLFGCYNLPTANLFDERTKGKLHLKLPSADALRLPPSSAETPGILPVSPASVTQQAEKPNPTQVLSELKQKLMDQQITPEEYEKQRTEILRNL